MYNYSYSYGDGAALGALTGGLIAFLIFISIIAIGLGIFQIVCEWKVFKKAGKNGWEAIIPFYNEWVFFEISGYPGWLILISLISFIPIVGAVAGITLLVFSIMASISLAQKFGKSSGFGVLLALVPVVGYAILAFSDVTYDETLGTQPNKPASNSNNANKVFCSNCGKAVPSDTKFCPNCGKEI